MKNEQLQDWLIATVAERVGEETLERLLRQPFSEYGHDFLGFLHVYHAATFLVRKNTIIIDFGCYMGVQAALFPNNTYVGVDPLPTSPAGGEFWVERYTADHVTHFVGTAAEFIDVRPDLAENDNVLAICSYVPDQHARQQVRDTFFNVLDYYPPAPTRQRSQSGKSFSF